MSYADFIVVEELLKSFITLFVIMDPFGSLPVFITLTRGLSSKEIIRNANRAVFVAGILLFIFLFFGIQIFNFFNISIGSFMIAGGIILLIIGIMYALGIVHHTQNTKEKDKDVASVPIGTPLLTGPGVITSTIILVGQYGILIPFIAAVATLLIAWLVLKYSEIIFKLIGRQGAKILSRVMGIILAAIAVEFIKNGITGYLI